MSADARRETASHAPRSLGSKGLLRARCSGGRLRLRVSVVFICKCVFMCLCVCVCDNAFVCVSVCMCLLHVCKGLGVYVRVYTSVRE